MKFNIALYGQPIKFIREKATKLIFLRSSPQILKRRLLNFDAKTSKISWIFFVLSSSERLQIEFQPFPQLI